MKKDELIHIRVGKQLKRDMNSLIEEGVFSSHTELAREAIRTLILKYREHYPEGQKAKKENQK
jgi:Arc/MetJ-type ribon-helix-helix transcriptional regulator